MGIPTKLSESYVGQLEERLAALESENKRLLSEREHTLQWYGVRLHWLKERLSARLEIKEIYDEFIHIVANGTPNIQTPPTYQQILNMKTHRLEALEAERARLRAALKPFASVIVCHDSDDREQMRLFFTAGMIRAAAEALKEDSNAPKD